MIKEYINNNTNIINGIKNRKYFSIKEGNIQFKSYVGLSTYEIEISIGFERRIIINAAYDYKRFIIYYNTYLDGLKHKIAFSIGFYDKSFDLNTIDLKEDTLFNLSLLYSTREINFLKLFYNDAVFLSEVLYD